jgi:hypothetical protein
MSRAAYYREYRLRKKVAAQIVNVAQLNIDVKAVAQQIAQHVAQQISDAFNLPYDVCLSTAYTALDKPHVAQHVAQQSPQQTQQQKKGVSFPPSSPPSHPPHTPPYSSPLLSPQSSPKKGPAKSKNPVGEGLVADFPDQAQPDPPMVVVPRSKKLFATWSDFDECVRLITDETLSSTLVASFMDWVEYKIENEPSEFYTSKGLVAEAKKFIKRHREDVNVPDLILAAMAGRWKGWDHQNKYR